ncbi:MAG: DUF4476 domain-containing protein [Bacteroidia bacterium]|nr:DUF4476 domain-containing protein [Bacteroidia bacterium]
MKRVLILMAVVAQSIVVCAQQKNCNNPLSNDEFQLKMNDIINKPNDAAKLEAAKKIVHSSCLLSAQVKQLAKTFQNDINRLDFVKASYNSTFDKNNFYDVYDEFAYFSTVFKLHDYIESIRDNKPAGNVSANSGNDNTSGNTSLVKFPKLDYPDCTRYNGAKGCPSPMGDKDFNSMARQFLDEQNDAAKTAAAEKSLQSGCFSVEQLMKIATTFKNDKDKLNYFKKAYFKCYDQGNFGSAQQVFNEKEFNKLLLDFIASQGGGKQISTTSTTTTTTTNCQVLNKEFKEVIESVKNQKFENTKITVAKQAIQAKKCFTAFQIKEIAKLMNFEEGKLDVAKFAWDYCIDRENNYSLLNEIFSFDSSKNDLYNFTHPAK